MLKVFKKKAVIYIKLYGGNIMSEQENIFKNGSSNNSNWLNYNAAEEEKRIVKEREQKYLEFKERISKFENIVTLDDARALAKQILPTAQELSQFRIGTAICTVVNKNDMVRISLDSDKEFICYDFA